MSQPPPSADEVVDIAADAEAIAEMEAGQGIPHEAIKTWLLTWGKKDASS